MEDYKKRLLLEQKELFSKIERLVNFLKANKETNILTTHERLLMEKQLKHMNAYLEVLIERTVDFKNIKGEK